MHTNRDTHIHTETLKSTLAIVAFLKNATIIIILGCLTGEHFASIYTENYRSNGIYSFDFRQLNFLFTGSKIVTLLSGGKNVQRVNRKTIATSICLGVALFEWNNK